MVKVATLKDQAREYERQGDIDKALAIYGHILTHLEGTPAIKGQLPLYVKVGDLQLKQGDTESAINMYQRAADQYAEHGSAKSVIALCLKILRVAPKHTTVYLTYARRLMGYGHLSAAREVLTDFAERASLQKPLESLQRLQGRPAAEVRPVLERMLAGVRKPEEEEVGEDRERQEDVTPAAPISDDAGREPPRVAPAAAGHRPTPSDLTPEVAAVARHAREFQSESPEERHPLTRADAATAEPTDDRGPPPSQPEDLSWMRDGVREASPRAEAFAARAMSTAATASKHVDRRPFAGFARDAERRKATSRVWLVGALFLILVAIGSAFVKLGVIPVDLGPRFGGPRAERPAADPVIPSAAQQPVAIPDSSENEAPLAQDSGVVDPAVTGAVGDTASRATARPARAPAETTPAAVTRADTVVTRSVTAPRDPPRPRRDAAAPVSRAVPLPAGTALTGPVVVIRGLAIDSVTEFPSGDLLGVRVIHVMDSGEPLILRAVPVGPAMGDTATSGAPRVTTLRGDTAFGTRVFSGYLVNAKGKVGAERLDSLLRQLVRLEPDN